MKYCHKCGAKIEDKDKFCNQCGARMQLNNKFDETKQNTGINFFHLIVKIVTMSLIILFTYTWFLDYISFLDAFLVISGLGLTLSVFFGKKHLFTLAFGWGIFMLTMQIIGYLSDFDLDGRLLDVAMWIIVLFVLYKINNEKE